MALNFTRPLALTRPGRAGEPMPRTLLCCGGRGDARRGGGGGRAMAALRGKGGAPTAWPLTAPTRQCSGRKPQLGP